MTKLKNKIKLLLNNIQVIYKNNRPLILLALLVSSVTIILLLVILRDELNYKTLLSFLTKISVVFFGESKLINRKEEESTSSSEEEVSKNKAYPGEKGEENDKEDVIITPESSMSYGESPEWWVSKSEPDYKETAFDFFDEREKAREKEISVNLELVNADGCKPHDSEELLRDKSNNSQPDPLLPTERRNASGCKPYDSPELLRDKSQRSPIDIHYASQSSNPLGVESLEDNNKAEFKKLQREYWHLRIATELVTETRNLTQKQEDQYYEKLDESQAKYFQAMDYYTDFDKYTDSTYLKTLVKELEPNDSSNEEQRKLYEIALSQLRFMEENLEYEEYKPSEEKEKVSQDKEVPSEEKEKKKKRKKRKKR